MDALINWARNLSYDIIGIFLPGLFLTMGISIILYINDFVTIEEFIKTVGYLDKSTFKLIPIILVLFLIYMLGVFLKALGEYSHIKIIYQNKKYGFSKDRLLENYSNESENLYSVAKEQLFKRLSLSIPDASWTDFYKTSKSYLLRNNKITNIVTYQNRYELHRSISLASLIIFFIIIIQCLFTSSFSLHVFLICLMFFGTFDVMRKSFIKYWRILGDLIIVDVIIEIESEKKK